MKTRSTFSQDFKEVLWDEGSGPVSREQRIQPVIDAVPKVLLDRLDLTRKVPSKNGDGLPTTYEQPMYSAWAVMVAVNPDVLIVTVFEASVDLHKWQDYSPRGDYIRQRVEWIGSRGPGGPAGRQLSAHAGSLVPWSDEMYVVSTDSKVEYRRLKFENNQATILLPAGKLVLSHHEDDVDITRE